MTAVDFKFAYNIMTCNDSDYMDVSKKIKKH